MRKRCQLEHAVGQLYEAVVRPEIWPDALHAVARSMNAVGTILCQPYDVGLIDAGPRLPASHDLRDPLAKRLNVLVPHLARVIRLARRFSVASARTLVDVLNTLGDGAIVVGRLAKVMYLNSRAETIVSRGCGICVKHGRLVASDSSAQARLDQLIGCATMGGVVFEKRLLQPVVVKDASARRLLIEALPGTASNVLGDGHAVLVLTDSEDAPILNPVRLRALRGLSEAEVRLAVALGSGKTLAQAAESLGVAYETARSQLKAIFVKTNTHRQAELLRLLVQLASGGPRLRD